MSPRNDPSSARPLDVAELRRRLAPVLADLTYPALRWQALTTGDLYGCDSVTRTLLDRLPERRYGDFGEIVAVLAAVLAGRAVPAQPTARPGAAGPVGARIPTVTMPGPPAAAPAATGPAVPPSARATSPGRPPRAAAPVMPPREARSARSAPPQPAA